MSRLYDGNAVRKIEPEISPEVTPKPVHKLRPKVNDSLNTSTEAEKNTETKKRARPINIIANVTCVLAFFFLSTVLIYGYVQVTEISNEIIIADTSLNELVSEQIQLEMEVATILNATEVESYAQNQLGMDAVNSNQIIYVTMETENKGEIVVSEGFNLWGTVLEFFGFR